MIDAAIFVENDARRAKEVHDACPGITVHQVADSSAERSADTLPASIHKKSGETPELRYKAGIGPADIRAIKQWVSKTAAHTNRAALFDWGRTITQMKGVHALPTTAAEAEVSLEALCGGHRRLATIRRLFDYLYDNHVNVYILTNNERAKTHAYKLLVRTLLADRPFTIIASGKAPSYSNKGRALTRRQSFRRVCGPSTAAAAAAAAAAITRKQR